MKNLLPVSVLVLATALAGCATKRKPATTVQPAPVGPKMIVTADAAATAKVVLVRPELRFVILNFPYGQIPKPDQHMFLYRDGLKVAEIKITGQPQEACIAADILSGDAQVGDTVRDQ